MPGTGENMQTKFDRQYVRKYIETIAIICQFGRLSLAGQLEIHLNHVIPYICMLYILVIVSPVRSTYGGYYGLVGVPPPRPPRPRPPRPQTLHRSHDNLKNPYRIASIFYM